LPGRYARWNGSTPWPRIPAYSPWRRDVTRFYLGGGRASRSSRTPGPRHQDERREDEEGAGGQGHQEERPPPPPVRPGDVAIERADHLEDAADVPDPQSRLVLFGAWL